MVFSGDSPTLNFRSRFGLETMATLSFFVKHKKIALTWVVQLELEEDPLGSMMAKIP